MSNIKKSKVLIAEADAQKIRLIGNAEAKAIERRLNRIDEAGQNGNWQADAWYLERRYPHLFGKRDTIAIESEDRPKVTLKWADGNILENDEEEDIKVLETKEVVKPELEENND